MHDFGTFPGFFVLVNNEHKWRLPFTSFCSSSQQKFFCSQLGKYKILQSGIRRKIGSKRSTQYAVGMNILFNASFFELKRLLRHPIPDSQIKHQSMMSRDVTKCISIRFKKQICTIHIHSAMPHSSWFETIVLCRYILMNRLSIEWLWTFLKTLPFFALFWTELWKGHERPLPCTRTSLGFVSRIPCLLWSRQLFGVPRSFHCLKKMSDCTTVLLSWMHILIFSPQPLYLSEYCIQEAPAMCFMTSKTWEEAEYCF